MEPGLLAGDARCPPTSSWWALETPVILARRGSYRRTSGGHGGGGCTIGGEIVQQPPSRVFFNTARPEGHVISGMWTELEEGGSTAKRQQEKLLRWQNVGGCRTRMTRSRTAAVTVPKLPYRPDGETSEKTRVTRGHPHQGDSHNPYITTGRRNFTTRWGV